MKKIVIFSGAGLSAESGIPTFRGSGGLWEGYAIEEVATPLGWQQNPQKVLDFYAQRFEQMQRCQPNAAHRAIAKLSQYFDVTCLTQNIDTLLEQAGVPNVKHLHGRIDYQKCEWHLEIPTLGAEWQCDYKASLTQPTQLGDLCPKCGKQLRPDVVWFGEAVDMDIAYQLADQVQIFIGVGTSATVYPAAKLLRFFNYFTPEKYFIDPHPNYEALQGYTVLEGTATEQLPPLVENLISNLVET
ncbi:SIR2 family NAD-dependent protein deacylase [Planktothrix mougeotii]|uniref:protein acetyllysine N-acetyltransferase n=1 Tax=Planktothrix mougeotii LEGE 06226 TaxID=1828728 RepID=A0ABR9U9M3_9CYAN|nr:Sir2 family NAD-dependent protein deacetylase [Planktothrix mougeotii]MBE9143153.1 silent information regulator protein Sir2 [Planktothrix mougeotii LEGE 06226]